MRLRIPAALAVSVLSSSCASPPARTEARAAPGGQVELSPADADVWAFAIDVRARLAGGGGAAACFFDTNHGRTGGVRRDDTFTATLDVDEGANGVVATCRDGRGHEFRSAPAVYTGKLRDAPTARALATAAGRSIVLDGSTSQVAAHSHAALARFSWSVRRGLSRPAEALGDGSRLEVPQPTADGEYTYELRVTDTRGGSDGAAVGVDVEGGRAAIAGGNGATDAEWARAGVVYGVIPPLFGAPPLRAVREALPELAHLGVAALWLSPLFEAAEGDFGYAVTDSLRVRSDYGTLQDLRDLVGDAHGRGLRIVLDFVPNHTSDAHRYYRQAAALGARSHYYGFYDRTPAGTPTHYFDWTNLPNLNYRNPEVRSLVTAVGLDWIRDAGIDGYRVDAAWGLCRRAPSFLSRWTAEIARVAPRAFLLAEASARDPFYVQNGFTAAYDWTEELGHAAWEHVFDAPDGVARRLDDAVETTRRISGDRPPPLRFLNDNDTGARFITRHGLALTRVATIALLTLPGVPLLYSFDEGGAAFEPYDERAPSVRTPHPELVEFHRRLIELRRDVASLHGPGLEALYVGAHDEGYVYLRRAAASAEVAVVALNFGAGAAKLPLALPADIGAKERRLRSVFASEGARRDAASVELPPFGYEILVSD
ncbi:MAG TPA: alpha-amylase family glycosyl hydrolase [Polyangiaceae bacterium]|nr:alpha-amylase family glycosyl hydrolase [Polyangiaceae bacterium]